MKNSERYKEKVDIIEEFNSVIKNSDFKLCPVTYQLIKRHQKLIRSKM